MCMILIVGLGNIGKKYENTHHNVGFLALNKIAESLNVKFNKRDCFSQVAEAQVNGKKVMLAKPETYMNRSGVAVLKLITKYRIKLKDVVVIYDDVDIDASKIRVRDSGSAGTHNGMRSIVENIGKDFARIRIGIGPKPDYDLGDFVLDKLPNGSLVLEGIKLAAESGLEFINREN